MPPHVARKVFELEALVPAVERALAPYEQPVAPVSDALGECLACIVDTSIGGVRVVREPERLVMERSLPGVIVCDDGCELTSSAVLRWSLGRLDRHHI